MTRRKSLLDIRSEWDKAFDEGRKEGLQEALAIVERACKKPVLCGGPGEFQIRGVLRILVKKANESQ